ncbi:MAG: 30S ribosomal protein S16 [Candidatus Harrisonbacteria bacterium CG10_big_fil_rev_8_21_14_0_10_45_28]|uniref:Small ribosomal subunit protein bS16 n=1 Tax=Candidatus Harrisonbacteria bacterium CG10_big_fil_rev_8_21_14_0_10_45_28 TaxID=1974586 RepID=A0A2H0UR52_9BACT|nr:MAG: 30S ribosomal protein S16 [Candidatus Harrisonbacteria bacterium CG10_big_fil_rev_8_21_14_0_10_45_28]
MVVLRYQRHGKKHQVSFRVVADTKRSKLDGASIEDLGWYNPHSKEFGLKEERIKYWLSVGAKPSNTVHNLLVSKGIIEGKKIPSHKKSKKPQEDVSSKASATEEAPAPKAESKPEVATEEAKTEEASEPEKSE